MPSAFCRGGNGNVKPYTSPKRSNPTERRSRTGRARGGGAGAPITFRVWLRAAGQCARSRSGAWSPRGWSPLRSRHLSPPEAEARRVSANAPVLRPSGDGVGERARAPTFATNAPRGPASLLRVPLHMRPQHLAWPQYRPPRSGPSRKTQQGRRPAACKGGAWPWEDGARGRPPGSPQRPRLGGDRPRRCPSSNSPDRGPLPHLRAATSAPPPRGPRSPR